MLRFFGIILCYRLQLGMNRDRLQEVVEEQEVHVESLQQELQDTQTNYQKSFQENAELKETLASLTSLQDQQQLLIMEVWWAESENS